MKAYPSISHHVETLLPIVAFDKLNGSNVRAEWSAKRGWYKFGTRHRVIDNADPLLSRVPELIIDKYGARVGHVLDEMDEWIGRAGEAERTVDAARRRLACVADDMTEHAYQELASALESPPRIAGKTAGFDQPGREYTAGDALGLRRDR